VIVKNVRMQRPVWRRARPAVLAVPLLLGGCYPGVLSPAGYVGASDRTILLDSLGIMLAIIVPTIVLTLSFAYWFRASNKKATYLPTWAFSGRVEMVTWGVPLLTIMLLGGVTWVGAHQLDPAEPIPGGKQPLVIQGVSLDWKWLFIYPDQHVATVNELYIPAGTPVKFELTSASVMNAFFVPQLGSMIYTMNAMSSTLNLIADKPGDYRGVSAHYSGDGFADEHFTVHAVPEDQFTAWVGSTQGKGPTLDDDTYKQLMKPSMGVAPYAYGTVEPDIYNKILSQALPPSPYPANESSDNSHKTASSL
jgi:cytochrome o ubiquinol oxidase subunit 2